MIFNFKRVEHKLHQYTTEDGAVRLTTNTITITRDQAPKFLANQVTTERGGVAVPVAIEYDEANKAIRLTSDADGFRFRYRDGRLNLGKPKNLEDVPTGSYKLVPGMDNVYILSV